MTGFLDVFFDWLWSTTLRASVLALAVLLLQHLLRSFMSARCRSVLWWLVIVALILPVAPSSQLSIFRFTADLEGAISQWFVDASFESADGSADSSTAGQRLDAHAVPLSDSAYDMQGESEAITVHSLWAIGRLGPIPLVWLIGVALFAVHIGRLTMRLSNRTRWIHPVTDQATLDLLEQCKLTLTLATPVTVMQTRELSSPALLGVVRPKLLLPVGMLDRLTREELRCVFLHELSHIKRRDILTGWITLLVLLVHWFNPLVWLVVRGMQRDRELACDAMVLSKMPSKQRTLYGQTVIKLLEQFVPARRIPAMAGILERRSELRQRLRMIAAPNVARRWHSIVATLICGLLGVLFITDAPTPEGPADEVSSDESALANVPIAETGRPAPEMINVHRIGDPDELVSLASMPDQVVVLMFWATYCALPIDHLNGIVDAMQSSPVRFVAINHESEKATEAYLSKYPLKFEIAHAASEEVYDQFSAHVVPHIALIDRQGLYIGATRAEDLTVDVVGSLVAGVVPQLVPKSSIIADLDWDEQFDAANLDVPYIRIEATRSDSGASQAKPGSGRIIGDGLVAESVIQVAYQAKPYQVDWRADESDQQYRVSVFAPHGDDARARTMLGNAIEGMLSIRARWETREREVVVLRRTPNSPPLSISSKLDEPGGSGRAGLIDIQAATLTTFTGMLESFAFGTRVIDETNLDGRYDFKLEFVPGDRDSFDKALLELGFTYERTTESVQILVVEPQASGTVSDKTTDSQTSPEP